MSKIKCKCGYVISDSTDFIAYKGHLIADQDYYDFYTEIENKDWHDATSIGSKYFNEIFQCTNCQNIIIIRNNKQFNFKSIDSESNSKVLNSHQNEKWTGIISANFYNGQGELYWYTNLESGFLQELSLTELKETYFRKYNEFQDLKILRHSFLRINGEIKHNFEL
ncbi:hypothetical protein GTQ40_16205 [Flavobacteriaceae bacterium R38]|nr:hypothetical protein [Flavobacteriaceae bacterium R38]